MLDGLNGQPMRGVLIWAAASRTDLIGHRVHFRSQGTYSLGIGTAWVHADLELFFLDDVAVGN